MAYPSVTYVFANSSTADASQVNQNFTDVLNGLSDGTKDLNVSAITAAGTATFNGHVNLGNGTPDDITVSGSLASSIPVKTTFSYDVGTSTIGLKSIYFGSNDSAARTTRVIAGAVGSSYTLTLPTGAGSAGQSMMNLGSGSTAFLSQSSIDIINAGLSASVGSNALTVALKGADGSDPSATNPVYITFRNSTLTTGTPVIRAVTSALSVVVSSGSTLGHASAVAQYVYVYAIDNAGTVELAVSGQKIADEGGVISTTAEGGAGAADSGSTLYSTTARSNVAIRLIGRLKSTQATAGTWATAIAEITTGPFSNVNFYGSGQIHLSSGNGHGSSGTKIRRWSTVTANNSADLTLTQDATNGDSVTVVNNGIYFVSYMDYRGASVAGGISINASSLTTQIQSLASSEILAVANDPVAGNMSIFVCYAGPLQAGAVLRAHDDGNMASVDGFSRFYMTRLS